MAHSHLLAILLITVGGQAAAGDRVAVDVELVLAADTSKSMVDNERRDQVDGYAQAFRDPEVIAGITSGRTGRIAVTYVEWSEEQRVIVPWTLIDDAGSAERFAAALARAPIYQHHDGTNIGGALGFCARALRENEFDGARLVIDISGDGQDNSDSPPDRVRDEIGSQGITINGLPLDIEESVDPYFTKSAEAKRLDQRSGPIDAYYRDHVIGGRDSFFLVAKSMNDFGRMLRLKLMREIAAR